MRKISPRRALPAAPQQPTAASNDHASGQNDWPDEADLKVRQPASLAWLLGSAALFALIFTVLIVIVDQRRDAPSEQGAATASSTTSSGTIHKAVEERASAASDVTDHATPVVEDQASSGHDMTPAAPASQPAAQPLAAEIAASSPAHPIEAKPAQPAPPADQSAAPPGAQQNAQAQTPADAPAKTVIAENAPAPAPSGPVARPGPVTENTNPFTGSLAETPAPPARPADLKIAMADDKIEAACLPDALKTALDKTAAQFKNVSVVSTTVLHTRNHSKTSVRARIHAACEAADLRAKGQQNEVAAFLRKQPGIGGVQAFRDGIVHVDVKGAERAAAPQTLRQTAKARAKRTTTSTVATAKNTQAASSSSGGTTASGTMATGQAEGTQNVQPAELPGPPLLIKH